MFRSGRILAVAALVLPAMATATEISYDYVQVAFVSTELDLGPVNVDGDGFNIQGSVSATKNVFVFLDYLDLGFDFGVDASTLELGGGYHKPMSGKVDLIGTIGYARAAVDVPGGPSPSEDGFALSIGLRGNPSEKIEVRGRIVYINLDDDNTQLELFGDYYVTQAISLGAGVIFDDDTTTWGIGGRLHFGSRK